MAAAPVRSPWLDQLEQDRPHFRLEAETETDIAIVGGGIAGIATAHFLLKRTTAKVLLLEAGRLAHGATGHNAGQVVSYFERQLPDLAAAYGEEKAIAAQTQIESAWGLLDDILSEYGLMGDLHRSLGHSGWSTLPQILRRLEDKALRARHGLTQEPLLIALDAKLHQEIPQKLLTHALTVPRSTVLRALTTEDTSFLAADSEPKACLNSALFCERLVAAMLKRHGDRLTVVEKLPLVEAVLRAEDADLFTTGPMIRTKRVVLCTNGFENFRLTNLYGDPVDPRFHAEVQGVIGYMAGYLEPRQAPALAVSYVRGDNAADAYHYLTRRPYERGGAKSSLLCIGGPERLLPAGATYEATSAFPADLEEELERALVGVYREFDPKAKRDFLWHGLMGYTPTGVRRIGYEPKNRVLLYNLGCNGVGILPSIYGGHRIAQLLAGQELPESLFDPN